MPVVNQGGLAAVTALMVLAAQPGIAQAATDTAATSTAAADTAATDTAATASTATDANLDSRVMTTLKECQQMSTSCADMTKNPVGILVFPAVVKADLIIGGAGGKGALIENGKITSYYNIGAASAGLQAGIESASQVYVFRTADALNKLKQSPDFKLGASAGVTLVTADANAQGVTGDVLAYVFDAKGLHGGISLDVFDVWKTGQQRPRS